MGEVQAKKTVLVAMVALSAIGVFRANQGDGSTFKRLWATGALSVMLSVAADFAPAVAGPFAVLVVLGSLTNGGDTAIGKLFGIHNTVTSGNPPASGNLPAGTTTTTNGSTVTKTRSGNTTTTTTTDPAGNTTHVVATGP